MTKAEDIARRWIFSEKGQTPAREAKAKATAKRMNVAWADVLAAAEALKAKP